MMQTKRTTKRPLLLLALASYLTAAVITGMELFQVRLVEHDSSRLIATSNYNYAISSPRLAAKNWRIVSVNGDQVLLITTSGELETTTRADLGPTTMVFIEGLRDEIANSSGGYMHVSTAGGSGPATGSNFMMSSGSSMSSSSSSSFSSGNHQSTSNMMGGGDMSYNMKDKNNFSVSRSDLPFNWSRVFYNGDLVTLVYRNGDVKMMPTSVLEPSQSEAVNKIKHEIGEMQRTQAKQITNTMQQSMDMVSNIFNNIMSSFPKPPDYGTSVGNMFGDSFPFGSKNSPFSSSSGWPFGLGGGATSVAFASGRRR